MKAIKLLGGDGYIRLIETWGKGDAGEAEAGIIEAARQSTQGSFRGWDRDQKLLEFLYRNDPKHATPFEFAGAVIEAQLPIFVIREWHRHRTQSYNEMSARYSPLPDINYVPTVERVMMGAAATTNRQAQGLAGAKPITEKRAKAYITRLQIQYARDQRDYEWALANGVPKELARVHLPVGRFTRMRATANLRNWLGFMTLRLDPGAQFEIRQYASAVEYIIAREFPRTWALFNEEQVERAKRRKVAC